MIYFPIENTDWFNLLDALVLFCTESQLMQLSEAYLPLDLIYDLNKSISYRVQLDFVLDKV